MRGDARGCAEDATEKRLGNFSRKVSQTLQKLPEGKRRMQTV